jgi:Tc5 transposase DNA-binding domain
MPRKRSARTAEIESKVNKAIEALKTKEVKSPYAAAKLVGLDLNTLMCRLSGGHNHAQSREQTQLLSIVEEDALALWCRCTSAGGCPIPHRVVREMAWEIMMHCIVSVNTSAMQLVNLPTIGKDWVKRFLQRYPRLKTVQRRRLEFS